MGQWWPFINRIVSSLALLWRGAHFVDFVKFMVRLRIYSVCFKSTIIGIRPAFFCKILNHQLLNISFANSFQMSIKRKSSMQLVFIYHTRLAFPRIVKKNVTCTICNCCVCILQRSSSIASLFSQLTNIILAIYLETRHAKCFDRHVVRRVCVYQRNDIRSAQAYLIFARPCLLYQVYAII